MRSAWVSELLKILTVRRQLVGLGLAVLAIPVTSLLVVGGGSLGVHDSVTSGAATGSVVGLLAFGAWAAAITAGEYSRGTVVVSLAVVPRRPVFYAGKLAALTAVAAGGALVSALVSLAVTWAVTPHGAHRLGNPVTLLGVVLAVVAVTAIGLAAGVLTRSPIASVALVLVVVLLPQTAAGLLGGLQPWVVGASPGVVVTQLVGNSQLASSQAFPAGAAAAAVTLVAVASAIVLGGGYALQRRDG